MEHTTIQQLIYTKQSKYSYTDVKCLSTLECHPWLPFLRLAFYYRKYRILG